MPALIRLKNALAVLFAAIMAVGAFYGAVKGLVQGEVFCLLCKRGSAPAPLAATPALFVISELMLLGLGAVCLAGAVYGLRNLLRPGSDEAAIDPKPPRRPSAAPAGSPWAGLLVHVLAALCMLATLVLGVLALNTEHSSSDLGFGVLLLWLMPIGTFFWGSILLALSPRPGVSRVGRWLLLLMVGACVVLAAIA
jgi:hypothetical protein